MELLLDFLIGYLLTSLVMSVLITIFMHGANLHWKQRSRRDVQLPTSGSVRRT